MDLFWFCIFSSHLHHFPLLLSLFFFTTHQFCGQGLGDSQVVFRRYGYLSWWCSTNLASSSLWGFEDVDLGEPYGTHDPLWCLGASRATSSSPEMLRGSGGDEDQTRPATCKACVLIPVLSPVPHIGSMKTPLWLLILVLKEILD